MKNFSSISIKSDGPIRLEYRGHADATNSAMLDIIDNQTWDSATVFIPNSETKALRAAIDAFNSAYAREKELDLLEAAE